jgi:C6 transcription factor Pro1
VSTGSRPVLYEYHRPLLLGPEPLVKLDEIMGCDSEVMILVSQIAELEAWKRECRAEGRLSYMMLTTRAAKIDVMLQAMARRLDGEAVKMKRAVDEVSRLFATAALVY